MDGKGREAEGAGVREVGGTAPYYTPPPPPPPSAPTYYGTFEGSHGGSYVPPGFPQPAPPSIHNRGFVNYEPVPGYPVDGMPIESRRNRLPCCGIGIGWVLFILGFLLASIPWYLGAISLICLKPDPRERVGLICCTIAAIASLIVGLFELKDTDW